MATKDKELYDTCHKLFEYKEGHLYWKAKTHPRANRIVIGSKAGHLSKYGYVETGVKGRLYRNHRLIFLMFNKYLPKYIDHIDRDRGNNRIENLRECTPQENNRNTEKSKSSSSGYKGVTYCKQTGKWKAQIKVNYRNMNLGRFKTPKEASEAYEKKAKEVFKEFYHGNQR